MVLKFQIDNSMTDAHLQCTYSFVSSFGTNGRKFQVTVSTLLISFFFDFPEFLKLKINCTIYLFIYIIQ